MLFEYRKFIKAGAERAIDDSHRLKILKSVSTFEDQFDAMKIRQFINWDEARKCASEVKSYVLENLPQLLESFEQNCTQRGVQVLWAETAEEARNHFITIATKHDVKKVIKSKSMTTEEIEFNQLCEARNIELWESDLGELIVQLAEEKPYHIVTPAMHKSLEEIAQLFHEKLNAPLVYDAQELTMIARAHLRNAYITADMGVTGSNFLVAEDGAVILTENEGNGRLSISCPQVHVVLAGIEKVIPRMSDLGLFLPLLTTSGTGQQLTCYNSIIRSSRRGEEFDGPEHMYVILLDNGRSNLYAKEKFRPALSCIRCGACLNACPVYRTIGGHSYRTTYQGPIGSVITPHLRNIKSWHHLSYASSLCAACRDACPVKIDIPHLLLENRSEAVKQGYGSKLLGFILKLWVYINSDRKRLDRFGRLIRIVEKFIRKLLPASKSRRIPEIASKSFAELWEQDEQQR